VRSQLMSEMEKQKNAKSPKKQQNIVFKQLWVILSKIIPTWKDHLFKVQPETVIRWHRTAFKFIREQNPRKWAGRSSQKKPFH